MPEETQKRQVAYKATIKEILDGKYVVEEGWIPNYIQCLDGRKIARINLIAVVIEKPINPDINFESIILDDSTGKISVRDFEKKGIFSKINIGDVILMIGRPREYGNERYVLPEIIKKIDNPEWIKLRKLELRNKDINLQEEVQKPIQKQREEVIEDVHKETSSEKIIDFIKKNDCGDGVDISQIIPLKDGEKTVRSLLELGEIFEVRPGRVKVLE